MGMPAVKPKAKQEPRGHKWGGARQGAGRKAQWPTGTTLKSMRLPANLEAELKQFARDRLSGFLKKITKSRRTRQRRSKTEEITLENAAYWIVIHKDTDEVLADTLARNPVDAIGRAEDHFGKL